MADSIAERLVPSHLLMGTTEELKQQAEAAVAPKPSTEEEKKLRQRSRRYTFDFSHKARNGDEFKGVFTSVIPDIRTKGMIGVMRAQLSGGVAFNALDPLTNELNFMVATMTFCLDSQDPNFPLWAKDLRSLVDVSVVYALFEEVSAHEATFLGRD